MKKPVALYLILLLCLPLSAGAASLSRNEIASMHEAGIRMALPNQRKPYVIPLDMSPQRLLDTELLDFSNITLYDLPPWLKKFSGLRKLDLSNSYISITGLVEMLRNMPQLEVLNLSGNSLFSEQSSASLGSVWASLINLRELRLANIKATANQLGSLAPLKNLLRLDLSENQLSQQFSRLELVQLTTLRQLNLSHNELGDAIFTALPTESLTELDLSHNQLNRIAFINFPHLKSWDLSANGSVHLNDRYGEPLALAELVSLKYDTSNNASNQSSIPQSLKARLFKRAGGISSLGLEMKKIDAGAFRMGCVSDLACDSNAKPVHTVNIDTFWISATEVTFAQWDACVAAGGCTHQPNDEGWGRGQHPVINVSWNDAQQFMAWLSKLTGQNYRLPTEAEWEYAARAGTSTQYSWGNQAPSCSKTAENGASHNGGKSSACYYNPHNQLRGTELVGSYAANAWGLYDMHGNVWEWTCSAYTSNYQDKGSENKCISDNDSQSYPVLRGGSWIYVPSRLRSAKRNNSNPDRHYDNGGFRLVRTR